MIEVTETTGHSIGAFEFALSYEDSVLSALSVDTSGTLMGRFGWQSTFNVGTDSIAVAAAGDTLLNGSGSLIKITFAIDSSALKGTSTALVFDSFLFNEGFPIPLVFDGALVIGIPYGDVSRDGGIHAHDAALILLNLAGKFDFTSVQEILAEVSGDGSITSFDASLILQLVVGLIDEFPAAGGILPALEPMAEFSIQDLSAAPGETIIFPVMIENAKDIIGLEATISFDPSVLTLEEFRFSGDFDGWLNTIREGEGEARLYLASANPQEGNILLGNAVFQISADPPGGSDIVLGDVRLNEESVITQAAVGRFSVEVISVLGESDGIPTEYGLSQNYPNPFNTETVIRYALPEANTVSLNIYNLRGEEIVRLVDGPQPAGQHQATWDAPNMASGIYFYRLQAGDFIRTRKMVLLK